MGSQNKKVFTIKPRWVLSVSSVLQREQMAALLFSLAALLLSLIVNVMIIQVRGRVLYEHAFGVSLNKPKLPKL